MSLSYCYTEKLRLAKILSYMTIPIWLDWMICHNFVYYLPCYCQLLALDSLLKSVSSCLIQWQWHYWATLTIWWSLSGRLMADRFFPSYSFSPIFTVIDFFSVKCLKHAASSLPGLFVHRGQDKLDPIWCPRVYVEGNKLASPDS